MRWIICIPGLSLMVLGSLRFFDNQNPDRAVGIIGIGIGAILSAVFVRMHVKES